MKTKILILLLSAGLSAPLASQVTPAKVTDSNTALHLLPPDYPVPYGPTKTEDIIAVLNRIYTFLDTSTPAKVIDRQSKNEINDMTKLNSETIFEPGVFRLISYEWGVAYGAMLIAAEATGDVKYKEYTIKRMNLISDVAQYFKKITLPPVSRQTIL
jgi:unsaturated rhamnogalacturonyl hydrolase